MELTGGDELGTEEGPGTERGYERELREEWSEKEEECSGKIYLTEL